MKDFIAGFALGLGATLCLGALLVLKDRYITKRRNKK